MAVHSFPRIPDVIAIIDTLTKEAEVSSAPPLQAAMLELNANTGTS